MHWRSLILKVLSLWVMLAPLFGWAQIQGRAQAFSGVDAAGNAETVEAALHQMSDRAAVIFVGTVVDVRRTDATGTGAGVVEVQFTVEQAIRGCSGSSYTLREWAGLWSGTDTRYRLGQRLLLLLHAPGATGLSSPVAGMEGAIPLRASGSGVRASDGTGSSETTANLVADLRWIGAKLARKVVYRAPAASVQPGMRAMAQAQADVAVAASVEASSTPVQEASVSTVVGMLRSWEVADASAR